ncbi:MAG TPA: pyridoxamine 5'-phosphate oxidase family protein [Bacillota bacterium]|jgi:hypothetical protein
MRGKIRRTIRAAGPEVGEEVLRSAPVGHLGTVGADGYPYVVPLTFAWVNGKVYWHSALEGDKLDNLRREPRVCFEALDYLGLNHCDDPCEAGVGYRSVVIFGRAREVPDGPEKLEALKAIVKRYGMAGPIPDRKVGSCAVVAIDPEVITAKFAPRQ